MSTTQMALANWPRTRLHVEVLLRVHVCPGFVSVSMDYISEGSVSILASFYNSTAKFKAT